MTAGPGPVQVIPAVAQGAVARPLRAVPAVERAVVPVEAVVVVAVGGGGSQDAFSGVLAC